MKFDYSWLCLKTLNPQELPLGALFLTKPPLARCYHSLLQPLLPTKLRAKPLSSSMEAPMGDLMSTTMNPSSWILLITQLLRILKKCLWAEMMLHFPEVANATCLYLLKAFPYPLWSLRQNPNCQLLLRSTKYACAQDGSHLQAVVAGMMGLI